MTLGLRGLGAEGLGAYGLDRLFASVDPTLPSSHAFAKKTLKPTAKVDNPSQLGHSSESRGVLLMDYGLV